MKIVYAHLLIVDDDEARCATLTEPIEAWGLYAVLTTADTRQALALLNSRPFDLIFLDLDLAVQDNFAILRRLQGDTRLYKIPIVILATADDMDRVIQCMELGTADFLLMPTHPTLLRAKINTYLHRKHLQEQVAACVQAFNEMEKLADDLRLIILPLGVALSAEKDFDRLLEQIVVEAKGICNADAGTLYLRTADDHLQFAITRTNSLDLAYGGTTGRPVPYQPLPLYDPVTGAPNHHNVATYVALKGESVNIPDIYHASGFDFSGTRHFDAQNQYRSISCLTVPLRNHEVFGVLQLLNAKENGRVIPFTLYHELVAESLASQAAVVLHNRLLRQQQATFLKLRRELEIGRQIQADFLPATLPQPDGWELVACFHPAREVAGDFYDAFPMPRGKVGLVIADVCDKGVGAALFMALVRSLIRAFAQQHYYLVQDEPVDLTALLDTITLTNAYIGDTHQQANMFATLFFGVLDPVTGYLMYVNAGHSAPLIFHAGRVKARLKATGPAVGLRANAIFSVQEVHLHPGDILLAYTDGLMEARNAEGEMFTEERLLALLAGQADSATAVLKRIEMGVHEHIGEAEPYDDITMLAVGRR